MRGYLKQLYMAGFALTGIGGAALWFAQFRRQNLLPILAKVIAAGIIAGRLTFVLTHLDVYSSDPLAMLDIRDGGVTETVALFAMFATAVEAVRRRAALRTPLHITLASGALTWIAATVLAPYFTQAPVQAPALVVLDVDGNAVDLATFRGKPTVINLWASWCPPCRREMPLLEQAQHKHPDVHFVFINQGEDRPTIQRYLQGQHLSLRNVFSDRLRQIGNATESPGMPTTLFYDHQGGMLVRHVGEIDAPSLDAALATFGSRAAPSQ